MIRIIRNSVTYDVGLEQLAKQLLINNNLTSYSDTTEIFETIYNFVKSNVVYIQDIAGRVESIKSARRTLSDGFGDCDDHCDTNASLLGCLGFEDVRVAMARYSPNDTNFSHVYAVCYNKGKRYVFDTTLPDGRLNLEVKAYEVKEISIFDTVQGLDGFSGLVNNTRHYAKTIAKQAVQTLPTLAALLPLGIIGGNSLATGANLISQSGNTKLSLSETASAINKELDKIIALLLKSEIAVDLAEATALQLTSQINTIEPKGQERLYYIKIRESIKSKLDFIKNFPTYARQNNIPLASLNPNSMLLLGLAGAGYGLYRLYKRKSIF